MNQDIFSIKVMHDFLNEQQILFLKRKIQNSKFIQSAHKIKNNVFIDEHRKIRYDYTLNDDECAVIDNLVTKSNCGCTMRERWRILYYDGDEDKKCFRDAHTDWTKFSCHRKKSIIIGLTDPNMYEGGTLHFKNNHLSYKIEYNSAIIFDSRLVHEVLPVTKGKRYVLQAFLFDEDGWNERKNNNMMIRNYKLQKMKYQMNKYVIHDDKNAIHGKIKDLKHGYIGKFATFEEVQNAINENVYIFTWHLPELFDKKWAGTCYGFTKDEMILKERENIISWKNEKNVISGIKRCDETQTLSILTCDGGPGNQIVGIKEGLLMSKFINRNFVFPPILQHYVLNNKYRKNKEDIKFWNFDVIFSYGSTNICNMMNEDIYDDVICYVTNKENLNQTSRCERIVNKKMNKMLLSNNRFSNPYDYSKLDISGNNIVVSTLYNNTKISNCFWNGCDTCKYNDEFIHEYIEICKNMDFSDYIKLFGDTFIHENFNNEPFISIHIRYPDYGNICIKNINKKYDENDIFDLIEKFCISHHILKNNVFIATSNQKLVAESKLNIYKMLKKDEKYDELESFIEQYICCKSSHFFYTGGIHAKPNHTHLRSTWSSFVLDYRKYLLKRENNFYFTDLF